MHDRKACQQGRCFDLVFEGGGGGLIASSVIVARTAIGMRPCSGETDNPDYVREGVWSHFRNAAVSEKKAAEYSVHEWASFDETQHQCRCM